MKVSVVYFRYLEILSRGRTLKIILCLFFAKGSVFLNQLQNAHTPQKTSECRQ